MNVVDQLIVQSTKDNPILGALLGVLMDGGRVVSTGNSISDLLSMVPDVFFFEQVDLENNLESAIPVMADYCSKDLIFVGEKTSVDTLWQIAHVTGAQVALFSQLGSDPSLCDYVIQEKDLRSALMNIRPLYEKLKTFKNQVHLDGTRLNKALFLDRDGVVIEDGEYLQNPDEVRLVRGAAAALKKTKEMGYRLVIVTNQSGIGRGMFNFSAYEKVNDKMLALLAEKGVVIDRVLKAPFYEDSKFASGLIRKSLRKPRPGMLHAVGAELRIDLSQSMMVGDRARDLMAAAVAGVQKVFLYDSKDSAAEMALWKQWPLRSRFENKKSQTLQGNWDDFIKSL